MRLLMHLSINSVQGERLVGLMVEGMEGLGNDLMTYLVVGVEMP